MSTELLKAYVYNDPVAVNSSTGLMGVVSGSGGVTQKLDKLAHTLSEKVTGFPPGGCRGWLGCADKRCRTFMYTLWKASYVLFWFGFVRVAGGAPLPKWPVCLHSHARQRHWLGACLCSLFGERPGPIILIRIHDAQVNLGVGGDRKTMASAAANKPIHVSGDKKVIRISSTADCLGFRV
jgi:hypothetical protein